MAKRDITVIIEGEISDKVSKDFHDRLAIALINQYGAYGAQKILDELKKWIVHQDKQAEMPYLIQW